MYNLTSNAVKALKDTANPRINWQSSLQDGFVHLSIADNGPGISVEQVDTLNGLGLHIIRDLAAAIDCKLRIVPRDNGGTTVTLLLNMG